MNDLLDVLAKQTSAGAYSTRRPLSGIRYSKHATILDKIVEKKIEKIQIKEY